MGTRHFLNLLLLLGFTGFLTDDANGQLLYSTLDNSNQPILRQTNLDGTGNVVFNIPDLAAAIGAQFSNDGQLIGISGQTFAEFSANQISTNVFVFNPATNQTQRITNNIDTFDPFTGNRLFTQALFQSFSPDGTLVAVGSRALFIGPATPNDPVSSTNGRTVTFFRVSDGQPLGPSLIDFNFIGSSTGVDGISWSPVADSIAFPFSTPSKNPLISGPTPIVHFNSSGQFLGNLTSPSGSVSGGFFEHDMYPSFSPNGVALAYFRSTRIGFAAEPSLLDLRITSPAGDRSILSFTPGLLPLGLSWSPDGTQLAFSFGVQPVLFTSRGFEADPTTASISVVNIDGSSPMPFLPPVAALPEYFPGTISTVRLGDVSLDGTVNFLDISPFISALSTGEFQAEADIDQNGTVNFLDISPFIGILSGQQ